MLWLDWSSAFLCLFPSAFSALANINLALEQGCALTLLKALQSPALGLRGLQTQNSDWYLKQLQSDQQQKRQVGGTGVGERVAAGPAKLFPQCLCPLLMLSSTCLFFPSMLSPDVSGLPFHSVPQVYDLCFYAVPPRVWPSLPCTLPRCLHSHSLM